MALPRWLFLGAGAPGSTRDVASVGGTGGPTIHILQACQPAVIACTVLDLASQSWSPFFGERLPPKSSSLNLRDQTTSGHQIRRSTIRMTIPIATIARTCALMSPLSIASLKYEPRPGTR